MTSINRVLIELVPINPSINRVLIELVPINPVGLTMIPIKESVLNGGNYVFFLRLLSLKIDKLVVFNSSHI